VADDAPASGAVLVLNAGSSSLKVAVVDLPSGRRARSALGERLGTPEARLRLDDDTRELPGAGHEEVLAAVMELVDTSGLVGVGHRVVHGGERFSASVVVDDDVVAAVEQVSSLAPLHNPPGLATLAAARALLPDLPHVAVFDTAFHATVPPSAHRYAVPQEWYEQHGVRRYGFHGTSHRYVSARAAELLGRAPEDTRVVVAHLGNGCSATAVRDGVSVDTTMGLTPLEGLVMGTRSGDVDPGLFAHLARTAGLDAEAVTAALNGRSGLLGLSGTSNDMRTVEAAAEAGDERAQLALDVFTARLAKAVGALAVPLERLDALVFTGGIGEHSATVRRRTLARLGVLGLAEDPAANARHGQDTGGRISPAGATVALVVPTDEELMIAQDTAALVGAR
jgi:acetate kinase